MPMVEHIAENGLVIHDEFREGNDSPSSRNLEFIKGCIGQMPEGKKIKNLRSDSAGYQADIINFCESEGIKYAIGADDILIKCVILRYILRYITLFCKMEFFTKRYRIIEKYHNTICYVKVWIVKIFGILIAST